MKLILVLIFVCTFSVLTQAQSLDYLYRNNGNLQVNAFWDAGDNPSTFEGTSIYSMIPLDNPGAFFQPLAVSCNPNACALTFGADFNPGQEYLLTIVFKGRKLWGNIKLAKVSIVPSKDVNKTRDELLVVSKVPVVLPTTSTINLTRSQLEISDNSFYVTDNPKPVVVTGIDSNGAGGLNNTELRLTLGSKLEEGTSTTFSIPTLQPNNPAVGATIKADGAIEISGLPAPTEAPSLQITLANIAAVNQKPVFDLSGVLGFRSTKFATLSGKYTEPEKSAACSALNGEAQDKCLENLKPINYFAGFKPTVTFDIGFNSTKSKNSIIVNLPLVYYVNLTNRSILDTQIKSAATANNGTPLYVYGGWANTPFFRLADIKLSFGPKLELYRKYYPRNLLITLRADFEFHRWLGTIASRRKLLSADLNPSASKDADRKLFGKLRGLNFGWKLVPYLAFDGGAKVNGDDKVEKSFGGIKQTVTIPKYNIARFSTGAVGTFEWLAYRRYVSFSVDYSVVYLASTETNSYSTDKFLLLRNIKGFQPFFKTAFEFSLDTARRYSFKTSWENGRTLPTLEYLNKLTTGVSIIY